jgi:hypothetical protein
MWVCTKCGRSLEAVALVGTPPPGFVVARPRRVGRLVLALLTLAAAAGVALLLSRLLRAMALEPEAAASTLAVDDAAAARTGADRSRTWKTLEQRLDEVSPPIVHQPSPPPTTAASAPLVSAPPVLAPPTSVAPVSAPPAAAPPASAPPAPRPVYPEPPRRHTASREARVAAANDGGRAATADEEPHPARLREERRAALDRARAHVRALEQRRDELRNERDDEASTAPDRRHALRTELAKVQRQLEQADRQLIRAEWALREAEQ